MRNVYILIALQIQALCCLAQDMHFSQYQLIPLAANPALAGVMEGNHRLSGNIRQQWNSIAGNQAWKHAYFSYDGRACINDNFLSWGIHLQSDRMGAPAFSNNTVSATIAYHQRLERGLYLSAGASAGALHYRIDDSGMTFDEQFSINGYDPGLPSAENFERFSRTVPSLSAGLLLFSPTDGWTAGAALHHINQPAYSFFGKDGNRLGMGVSLHGSATFNLSTVTQRSRLTVRGLFRRQSVFGNSRQWLLMPGAAWRYAFGQRQQAQGFSLGLSCRLSGHAEGQPVTLDAFIPAAYFDFDAFSLGFSYDVNVSSAARESYLRGGWEVTVSYQNRKPGCVVCPSW